MTRKNISLEEIEKKLLRGAIRKRTARRYYERKLAAWIKTPAYAKYKAELKAQQETNTQNTKDES